VLYKLIRTDLTLQAHVQNFVQLRIIMLHNIYFLFLQNKANILEKAGNIRSERKEAAHNCYQLHLVDTLLSAESKANW
jgi:hypothetical protein